LRQAAFAEAFLKILFAILLTGLPTWVNFLKRMPADAITPGAVPAGQSFIAPLWHTFSALLIFGYFSFRDAQHAQSAASSSAVASLGAIIRAYLLMIFYEWGMAAWAWGGVQFKGGNLRTLTGGGWTSWRSHAWSDIFEGWLKFV